MTNNTEWEARTEERYTDKSTWGPGLWQDEPDRVEWRYHGTPRFPLLIVRGPSGALCGYVGVPPGHSYHGGKYGGADVYVHGGLTYGAACQDGGKICHVARAGEPDDVWWLGFDCAHCDDYCPGSAAWERERYPDEPHMWTRDGGYHRYASLLYVKAEVERLAEQCARVAKGLPPRDPEDE